MSDNVLTRKEITGKLIEEFRGLPLVQSTVEAMCASLHNLLSAHYAAGGCVLAIDDTPIPDRREVAVMVQVDPENRSIFITIDRKSVLDPIVERISKKATLQ